MIPTTADTSYATSASLFERAQARIPGGVNSPVRAFKSVGGTPLFIQRGEGAYLYDVDGHRYLDYVGSWGPLILGHAHPIVVEAVEAAVRQGTSFGAPTEAEITLADEIISRVPGVEMVRLVNSGTEATMSAVRVARGATGRDKVIKFSGCYHGHADCFLIAAGSGALTLGEPNSPGVPRNTAADTLVARFNDLGSVSALLERYAGEVAAIIVEPVGGNAGCIPPDDGFLEGLRTLCTQHGTILIFDEVMTGFRIARGGAAERYGVVPDLYTFGKVIGGGMPIGAYAGGRDLMQQVAPSGPVYQAGTLSGNPVAVAAGLATLRQLTPDAYSALEDRGRQLEDRLTHAIEENGWPLVFQRVGSMFSLFFTPEPVRCVEDTATCDLPRFNAFFHGMLQQGVYLAPSAFESGFLSVCHDEAMVAQTVAAMELVLSEVFK